MLTFTELACPAGSSAADDAVDSQLWLACAGSMCSVPPVGAAVYYFPQGHAEQAAGAGAVDMPRVPDLVPCRVSAVRFMADPQSDEVFAKIRLLPLRRGEPVADVGEAAAAREPLQQDADNNKPASFAKTLTQSDANNGGGFSVPRFCAETIFPALDYGAEPPVQSIFVRDVHGEEFKFRHIYRGTPRRHLLTTGWSNFVNQKKLLAGDSVVFLRASGEGGGGGEVHVGIRRARRVFCGADVEGPSSAASGWDHYRGLMRGNASSGNDGGGKGNNNNKVTAEDVAAAARLAAAGQVFEVVYYPRASTPEFCVRAGAVKAAMQVRWCPGMRFKMAFETEDSSRISWFMGTVAGVCAADPVHWPQSPWRLLQVSWDEPELLQNVKRVCPWLVELVSSMPNLHLPSFSPPRKKPRIPTCADFPLDGSHFFLQPPFAPLGLNPSSLAQHGHHGFSFFPFPGSGGTPPAPAPLAGGIQGARHAHFGPSPSSVDLRNSKHPRSSLRPHTDIRHPAAPALVVAPCAPGISTDLTIGNGTSSVREDDVATCALPKAPPTLQLFGQEILTEEQMMKASSNTGGLTLTSSPNSETEKAADVSEGSDSVVTQGSTSSNNNNSTSSWRLRWFGDNGSGQASELLGLQPGQCKVFVESDAIGRNLDLSQLSSFEELYSRMSDMFDIESAELRNNVHYRSAAGEVKNVGDEPFRAFVKSARRLTIFAEAE